jgi:hypothetical protein
MGRAARRVGLVVAVLAAAAGTAGRAQAGLITTVAIDQDQEVAGDVNTLRFSFAASADGSTFPTVFGVNLTTASVGTTLEATAAGDPDFAALAAILTNGADNTVRELYEAVGGSPIPPEDHPESVFFGGFNGGVDLSGFTLDRITLRVDSLVFGPVGTPEDPVTNIEFFGTLGFEGEPVAANPIPAPPSVVLAGIAGVMFAGRTLRRRAA